MFHEHVTVFFYKVLTSLEQSDHDVSHKFFYKDFVRLLQGSYKAVGRVLKEF